MTMLKKCSKEINVHIPDDVMIQCKEKDFSGLHRVILTATGHLQRTVSALHNAPVSVDIIKNVKTISEDIPDSCCYSRQVLLRKQDTPFSIACSQLHITRSDYTRYFEEHDAGIGQFFQTVGIFPQFKIVAVGFGDNYSQWKGSKVWQDLLSESTDLLREYQTKWNTFWRAYELTFDGGSCEIFELFSNEVLQIDK